MPFNKGYAVVIGAGGDLPFTNDDAKAIACQLKDPKRCAYPPEQVRLLTEAKGEKPIRDNILSALEWLAQEADEDSTAVVYFSGHGQELDQYYLFPFGYNWDDLSSTAITGNEFTEHLNAIRARKLLVLLDCCHAGGQEVARQAIKSPVPPSTLEGLGIGGSRVLIASSRRGEYSFGPNPFGERYSVFTLSVLEALAGFGKFEDPSRDPYARVLDLAMWAGRRVPERTLSKQNPIIKVSNLEDNFEIGYYSGGKNRPKKLSWTGKVPIVPLEASANEVKTLRENMTQHRESFLENELEMADYVSYEDIPKEKLEEKLEIKKSFLETEDKLFFPKDPWFRVVNASSVTAFLLFLLLLGIFSSGWPVFDKTPAPQRFLRATGQIILIWSFVVACIAFLTYSISFIIAALANQPNVKGAFIKRGIQTQSTLYKLRHRVVTSVTILGILFLLVGLFRLYSGFKMFYDPAYNLIFFLVFFPLVEYLTKLTLYFKKLIFWCLRLVVKLSNRGTFNVARFIPSGLRSFFSYKFTHKVFNLSYQLAFYIGVFFLGTLLFSYSVEVVGNTISGGALKEVNLSEDHIDFEVALRGFGTANVCLYKTNIKPAKPTHLVPSKSYGDICRFDEEATYRVLFDEEEKETNRADFGSIHPDSWLDLGCEQDKERHSKFGFPTEFIISGEVPLQNNQNKNLFLVCERVISSSPACERDKQGKQINPKDKYVIWKSSFCGIERLIY